MSGEWPQAEGHRTTATVGAEVGLESPPRGSELKPLEPRLRAGPREQGHRVAVPFVSGSTNTNQCSTTTT